MATGFATCGDTSTWCDTTTTLRSRYTLLFANDPLATNMVFVDRVMVDFSLPEPPKWWRWYEVFRGRSNDGARPQAVQTIGRGATPRVCTAASLLQRLREKRRRWLCAVRQET